MSPLSVTGRSLISCGVITVPMSEVWVSMAAGAAETVTVCCTLRSSEAHAHSSWLLVVPVPVGWVVLGCVLQLPPPEAVAEMNIRLAGSVSTTCTS